VSDQLVWDVFALGTESRNGISQVRCGPRSDSRDQQVQAARPMHLVLVGAVAELAALADEESAARAVDGFTIVESALLPMSKLWIQQEFEDEDSLLQLSDLIQCAGDLILTRVGSQLAHDQRSRDRAVSNRRSKAENLVPVVFNQAGVDAVSQQLVERTVVLARATDGEQPLVEDVANARGKAEAQRRTQPEHVGRIYLDKSRGLLRIDEHVVERLAELGEQVFDALCGGLVTLVLAWPAAGRGIVGKSELELASFA